MTQPERPGVARVLSGRYELRDRLGQGGAGVVYRAYDRVLGRQVAVKLLHVDAASDPDAAARFRTEASAAAKLTHPNAVIVYDIGTAEGHDYLVMELVEGGTLAEVVATGPLDPGVVASVGAQVARALGTAHARGLVHRDVKPANVLLSETGAPKVADFGIARVLGETTSQRTAPGHVMGTARYLAPEQLEDAPLDARADVYSLGVVLHEAVTGATPFGDGSVVEVAMRRLAAPLPRPSASGVTLPRGLDDVLARATATDPAQRFSDGAELAAALAPFADGAAGQVLLERARRGRRARPTQPPEPAASAPDLASDEIEARSAEVGGTRALPVTSTTTAAVAPPPTRPPRAAGDDTGGGRRGRRAGALLLGVLLLTAIVTVALLGAPGGGTQPPEPVEITAARDHDPFGDDREEHPEDVDAAHDGDPQTVWQTARYRNRPDLGGLKEGVGIWFDLGAAQELTGLTVDTAPGGASFTVFAGQEPPGREQDPEQWGTAVAQVTEADTEQRVELDPATQARVVLLWFTELPPDSGGFRVHVSEVEIVGR